MDVVDVWTGRRASALRTALRMSNEAFARHLGAAVRTVAYWDAKPSTMLSPALQEVLDAALDQASSSARQRFELLCVDGTALAHDASHQGLTEADIASSAFESASDAALRADRLADAILTSRAQLVAVARRYSHRSPASVFADARAVRNITYKLADRTRRPHELADLYVLAGASNAVMASIAFDLGYWDSARTLVASATSYAQLAGHRSLEAWTWGLQATLANWRRDLAAANTAFERGIAIAPDGAPKLRLRHIAARTQSVLGDRTAVDELITTARDDREVAETVRDEFGHEIAGEFAFDDARAAACAAAAWLELGDAERAEAEADEALNLYRELGTDEQPFSPINGLRIDVSAARLCREDVEGTADALTPVLELEPAKRNAALVGRMSSLRSQLSRGRWSKANSAVGLAAAIDDWSEHTAAAHPPEAGLS